MTTNIEERIAELHRLKRDPLQFLKYVKIQEPGELTKSFELWAHLVEFWEALHKYPRIIVLKAKQIGLSWTIGSYGTKHLITVPGANVAEISNKELSAQKLLAKSQTVYGNLPHWLRAFTTNPNSSEAFGLSKTLDGRKHNSLMVAMPSTKTASIGENLSLAIHDEAEFHDYFEDNFGHTDAQSKKGQLVVVSTSDRGNPDSFFKRLYKTARDGKNDFKPFFFGALSRPDRDMEWYLREREIAEAQGMLPIFEQNYPLTEEEALSPMSATSCFKKEALDSLWQNSSEPIDTRQNFIYIYQPWKPQFLYGAGVDVGEGVGLDYSVCSVIGKYGLSSEIVALIYSNTISTDLFSYAIGELLAEYKNPLLFVENNGLGDSVIRRLIESKYPKLYYTGKEAGKEGKAGWTSSSDRVGYGRKLTAFNRLVIDINEGNVITRFKPQIQELMEYQWTKPLKFEPMGKTHGDTVISLMLANLAIREIKIASPTMVITPREALRRNYGGRRLRF